MLTETTPLFLQLIDTKSVITFTRSALQNLLVKSALANWRSISFFRQTPSSSVARRKRSSGRAVDCRSLFHGLQRAAPFRFQIPITNRARHHTFLFHFVDSRVAFLTTQQHWLACIWNSSDLRLGATDAVYGMARKIKDKRAYASKYHTARYLRYKTTGSSRTVLEPPEYVRVYDERFSFSRRKEITSPPVVILITSSHSENGLLNPSSIAFLALRIEYSSTNYTENEVRCYKNFGRY